MHDDTTSAPQPARSSVWGALLGALILAAGSGLIVSAAVAASVWLWRTVL